MDALNHVQRKAVMHGEGPLLVLAGPGSGKTFTITRRILYLIEVMQVPPEQILVITFTKEAAHSMQQRFREQSDRIYPVNFGTFHSVFYQILRTSNPARTKQILRENQKKNLMISILRQYNRDSQKEIYHSLQEDAGEFLSAISYYKNTGSREQALLKLSDEKRTHFIEIFHAYEVAGRQQGAIDFDDMVYECAKLLKKDAHAREYWQKHFAHIVMDEFQDINPMQYEVIRLLSVSPHNLFAVGDDDQAIYGFRGSNPACMRRFLQDYRAEKLCLNINYRSHPAIVKASLQVISENKERFGKELQSCKDKRQKQQSAEIEDKKLLGVNLQAFAEQEEQYTYLADVLRRKNDKDSCAVLFRTNMYMQSFAARLNRMGIAYKMKEKSASIYEHFIVKDIMTYLQLGKGVRKRALYLQILNKPKRMISREALNSKRDRDFILLEKQLDYLENKPLYLCVQYICKVIGYEHYLEIECKKYSDGAERLEEWKQILEWVKEEAKHYESLKAWQEAQELYLEQLRKQNELSENQENSLRNSREGEAGGTIHLMTVHASKGLEFDRVYIPDCNEKVYPHGRMQDGEQCEEERRIFYVGMTRAKKNLELLYLIGTKERPRLPSRFLNPLLKK